jgi:hypothetical protein
LLYKRIVLAICKEVKTGCPNSQEWTNLAEFTKEVYGQKRGVIPIIMINDKCNAKMFITYKITFFEKNSFVLTKVMELLVYMF